jgi:hypothetical protein
MSMLSVTPAHGLPIRAEEQRWLVKDLWSEGAVPPRRSKKPSTSQNGWLTSGQRQAGDVGDDDLLF